MSRRWTRRTLQVAYRLGRIDRKTYLALMEDVKRREEQERRQAAYAVRQVGKRMRRSDGPGAAGR